MPTDVMKRSPIVIIGGGVSGLASAYFLAQHGIRPTLIEQAARLGGLVHTETVQGCRIENGPDSFLLNKTAAVELIREIGLEDQLIGRNEDRHATFVWRDGRLQALPEGLSMMIPTRVGPMVRTGLLSWPTKLRMGWEWFRQPAAGDAREMSVAEFVRLHYGQETVDYLAEPLLAGVYGGDAEKMSANEVLGRFVELARKYGSLTKGVLTERGKAAPPEFRSLKGGMGQITAKLAELLQDRCDFVTARAEALQAVDGGWRVRAGAEWFEAPQAILAGTAVTAAKLLGPQTEAGRALGQIEHTSAATVMLGFERAEVAHPLNGFGFLVPKPERKLMLAATWVNTKFDHRATESLVLIRCFTGEAGMQLGDEALTEAMRDELREKMGLRAKPVLVRINRWPQSMPQYHVGHRELVKRIEAALPVGVHLVGNAYSGVGVPDCIRLARQAVAKAVGQAPVGAVVKPIGL
jgi:protoporphyrinogen/coproporphyrinogen III oxidase